MKKITKEEFLENGDFYFEEMKAGKVFVYPTDTVYGIGCDAVNCGAVARVREIKQRDEKPFSVIVPNRDWIVENCIVRDEKYLEELPGAVTFIFKLREGVGICTRELVGDLKAIGVRIPDNWFAKFLSEKGIVFVTTSANVSGSEVILDVSEGGGVLEGVDYVVDGGVLGNKASRILDLSGDGVRVLRG